MKSVETIGALTTRSRTTARRAATIALVIMMVAKKIPYGRTKRGTSAPGTALRKSATLTLKSTREATVSQHLTNAANAKKALSRCSTTSRKKLLSQ